MSIFNSLLQNEVVEKKILSLLRKKVIEVPRTEEGLGYYSTNFIVPKKEGGVRPILNLKEINKHLEVPRFKMETFRHV